MESDRAKLTPREEAYFEHVRQAKEQGVTLKEYCERHGLDVRSLYGVRRDLVKKGVVPRALARKSTHARGSKFVGVRVATAGVNGPEPVCRVRHPSGWVVECGSLPPAAWMAELLKGGDDAAT